MLTSDVRFDVYEYAIGGKMVVGRARMSYEWKTLLEDGDPDARDKLKAELIHQMADYMLTHKLVEFTYQDDIATGDKMVACRAYLAPDAQVKIIRSTIKV
jgi:hypothetical protein